MAILERRIQELGGDAHTYAEYEKAWAKIEEAVGGFPAKRHYRVISGPSPQGTIVWEREWESFTAMEVTYSAMWDRLEELGGAPHGSDIIAVEHIEFSSRWDI
jgi:hypothetical protein